MSRRRDADDDVSLFPFLSVIACVIGVLTLLISTLALAQMDNSVVADAEQYQKARKEHSAAEEELAELRRRIEQEETDASRQARQQREQINLTKEQLDKLREELEKAEALLREKQEIKIVIPEIEPEQQETVEDLQQQLAQAREEIAQLEKEIRERNLPPEESEVSVLPGGSGSNMNPYFVECDADSIVLHTQDPPLRIRAAEMVSHKQFIELLKQVAGDRKGTLLFLVRSDGLDTYRRARSLADTNEIPHGKLPVVGEGRIDLGYFNEARN